MNKHRLVVGAFGAVGFMAAVIAASYGCSSSDKGSSGATDDTASAPIQRPDSGPPDNPVDSGGMDAATQVFKAYATITSTSLAGAVANGQATFTEQNGEVTVVVDMTSA